MALIAIYSLVYLVAFVATIVLANKAQQFKDRHPSIDGATSLGAFKDLARVNMYFALTQIGVLLVGMLVGFVMTFFHGTAGLLFVFATNVVLVLLSLRNKKIETEIRSLPVTDELRAEYQRVCHSWVKKAFPDF